MSDVVKIFNKLKNITKDGKVCDYEQVHGAPDIQVVDLTTTTPVNGSYYQHSGESTASFTKGKIYYYDISFKPIDGSGSGGTGGLGSQEVEDIIDERLEQYAMIQALEEARYDLSEYGFASKETVETLSNIVQDLDQITIPEIEDQMVKTVKVGDTSYSPTDGVISLPAYPTGGGETSTTALSVVLEANGWVDNTQTVAVEGVTETNHVFVSAAGDPTAFVKSLIYPSAQGKNQITFTCEEKPTKNITVNVLILAKIVEVNSIEITLAAGGWNEAKRQAIEGLDISGNNNIISKPKGSPSTYLEAGIYCVSQGNGWLVFECDTVPDTDIEVIILTI